MTIGKFNISKITSDGVAYVTILDENGNALTTPDVLLIISLPNPIIEEAGEPVLTEDGLVYGEATMTVLELETALNDAW